MKARSNTLDVVGAATLDGITTINNNATITGTLGVGGAQTNTGVVKITAPTAVATATPAMILNNLGVGNNILEVQDSGTPVFKISNAGVVTGNVLQYAASGQRIVCGETSITGSGAIPHGLATPVYVMANMAADVAGDHVRLSTTNASATVTVKVWNSALTPAPATTAVPVDWCVVGTP